MTNKDAEKLYFEWLCSLCKRKGERVSFEKLLKHMYDKKFTYVIQQDSNRAEDGRFLRKRFCEKFKIDYELYLRLGECNVLEMMVAVLQRANDISDIGVADFFYICLNNMGLSTMHGSSYNKEKVDYILDKFLARDYMPDGVGSMFYIPGETRDMRCMEIWYQMNQYIIKVLD